MTNYITNPEWVVVQSSAIFTEVRYECCPERYPDISFHIWLMRHSAIYTYILIVPSVLLSSLTSVIFWLPPESPSKIVLGKLDHNGLHAETALISVNCTKTYRRVKNLFSVPCKKPETCRIFVASAEGCHIIYSLEIRFNIHPLSPFVLPVIYYKFRRQCTRNCCSLTNKQPIFPRCFIRTK